MLIITSLSVHIFQSVCKKYLNLRITKLSHDCRKNSLIQDQFQFKSKSSSSPSSLFEWFVSPIKSNRFRVFLTLYRMIYLTCIHSQTSWARHSEIHYGIYDIGIYGPSVRKFNNSVNELFIFKILLIAIGLNFYELHHYLSIKS